MSEAAREAHDHPAAIPGGVFVVLQHTERYVNAYVNNGQPVLVGQTVNVGPAMGRRLLNMEQMHPKSDLMVNLWREATDEEIETFLRGITVTSDVDDMSEAELNRAAREEMTAAGQANPDTEEAQLRQEALEETRDPLKQKVAPRRRRKAKAAATPED